MRLPWPSRSVTGPLVALASLIGFASPALADTHPVATYRVRMREDSPRLSVSASLPVAGAVLGMATTRPAGIPDLDSLGWAGLVRDLRVSDAAGRALQVTRDGERGWKLARPDTGTITLEYEVDTTPLQRLDWPAAREAAYRDPANFALVGRSLFVTTAATRECRVTFDLPEGWHASTAWRTGWGRESFVVPGPDDLVENLLVLSRGPHDDIAAGGFRVRVFAFGHWAAAREDVRRMLEPVVRHHVAMMGDETPRHYVVVLLPALEFGGESYRSSFALDTDTAPGPGTSATWGNVVAHEMFHLWNGWLLRGADYASTQWFQEGFTEYAANQAIATSGRVDADWFRGKLAKHVENARRLTTTLEDIGTRKGAPLYSAGALVAFAWDVRIRAATGGRRDLGDFFRALVRATDGGRRAYAWADLRAALEAIAPGDWERDYQSFIRGKQSVPVEQTLADVGQRLVDRDGGVRVEADPTASTAARARWEALLRAR